MDFGPTEVSSDSIDHLDFTLGDNPVVKEKKEKPKICGLSRKHEYDPEEQPCGRRAYVQISVEKSCGHPATFYVCKGCWTRVQQNPSHTWRCGKCHVPYPPMECVVRWELVR